MHTPHFSFHLDGGWGVCLGALSAWGCLPGGSLPVGVSARGCLPGGVSATHPHPVNRMTDRCKNITLRQTTFADGNNKGWRPLEIVDPPL